MTRLKHGEMLPLETRDSSRVPRKTWPFGYMFPDLQRDDRNLLEDSPKTVKNLRQLGKSMSDPGEVSNPGIPGVPAIHTFLGQFIDHDITLERGSSSIDLKDPKVLPLSEIPTKIVNSRSPDLELDSVYGPGIDGRPVPRDPANPAKMLLHEVEPGLGLPHGKDRLNDVPRNPNGSPQIGDPRNDENIITLQIHVALLRAHNALVDRGYRFDEARKLLRQHYQWIVLDEFLEKIADPNIVKMVRLKGPRFFNPPPRAFFMPLEFSAATYRFGHSKVRAAYDNFNDIHEGGGLDLLFRPGRRLSDDWIIEWPSFLDLENKLRFPRPIDTSLSKALEELDPTSLPEPKPETNLAVRNLLRGYILRMPTGQAVAKAMVAQGIRPMTEQQIASVADEIPGQLKFLKGTDFLTRTPLWFYVLAEAAFYSRGHHLGPVGSTIVVEVLIGVLRNSTDSILADYHWRPTLGSSPGKFDLEDLLKLAGVF